MMQSADVQKTLSGRGLNYDWKIVTKSDECDEPLFFSSLQTADKYVRGINEQYAKKSKRYYCRFHVECKHFVRIASPISGLFHVYQSGFHTSDVKHTAYGLPCALKPIIDKYLKVGYGPLNAIATVKEELRLSPHLASLAAALDEENKDKKKFQLKVQTRKTGLKHVAPVNLVDSRKGLEDHLRPFQVCLFAVMFYIAKVYRVFYYFKMKSKEQFDSMVDVNQMVVLSHQHPESLFGAASVTPLVETDTYLAEGFIFSSKRFLNNLQLLCAVTGTEVTLLVDGTFKVTDDGWVLIVVGTHSVSIDELGVHHTVRPILFCWTYSENAAAMKAIVQCLHNVARELLSLPVIRITVAAIDRSDAFFNGLTSDGTNDTSIVDCYAHMFRKIDTNEKTRISSKTAKKKILEDIERLSKAPTKEAFRAGLELAVQHWKVGLKQDKFVKYFREYYMGRWDGWYISATNSTEIGITTNAMESLNNLIKDLLPFSYTANDAIKLKFPYLLRALTEKSGIVDVPIVRRTIMRQLEFIKEKPIPREVIEKANLLVSTTKPKQWDVDMHEGSYFFNSKAYIAQAVTQERIDHFKQLLVGTTFEGTTWTNFLEGMSLHEVQVVQFEGEKQEQEPLFTCDCKSFRHSGFLCSHTLAARHLHASRTVSLTNMAAPFKEVKKRGRKRTNKGALKIHDDSLSQVAVDVVTLGALQPIAKPYALLGKKVFSEAGEILKICGYDEGDELCYKLKVQSVVNGVIVEGEEELEWSEDEVRRGLNKFKVITMA
jgi:hypothetical protein